MIGAMIARKKVISAFDALSRQDLDAFLAKWADDATLAWSSPTGHGFPDPVPALEGKEAIRKWAERFIGQWEVASFIIKNICVKRLCPIVLGSNVVTVEWDLMLKTKGVADESITSGVTVVSIKKGKAAEVRTYECIGDPIGKAVGEEEPLPHP